MVQELLGSKGGGEFITFPPLSPNLSWKSPNPTGHIFSQESDNTCKKYKCKMRRRLCSKDTIETTDKQKERAASRKPTVQINQ